MKLVLLHLSRLEYELTEKTASAEEIEDDQRRASIGECLAVYVTVEKNDPKDLQTVAKRASEEIKKVYQSVLAKQIVLNPFAHLSSKLASPSQALLAMKLLEQELLKEYEVLRCPSGWYKRILMDNKGHPLAALGRTIRLDKKGFSQEFKEERLAADLPKEENEPRVNGLIKIIAGLRENARKEKDWQKADEIRDNLKELGIILEDTSSGTRWEKS